MSPASVKSTFPFPELNILMSKYPGCTFCSETVRFASTGEVVLVQVKNTSESAVLTLLW